MRSRNRDLETKNTAEAEFCFQEAAIVGLHFTFTLLNIFFHGCQRTSPKPRQQLCAPIANISRNSLLTPTLSSSADTHFAVSDFCPEKIMTHLSSVSNPVHFHIYSLILASDHSFFSGPQYCPLQSCSMQHNRPYRPLPSRFFRKSNPPRACTFSAPLSFLLQTGSPTTPRSSPLPASLSFPYVHALTHPAHSKGSLALPLFTISIRISVQFFLSCFCDPYGFSRYRLYPSLVGRT